MSAFTLPVATLFKTNVVVVVTILNLVLALVGAPSSADAENIPTPSLTFEHNNLGETATPWLDTPFTANPAPADIKAMLIAAGQKWQIPPHILFGIAFQESSWRQFDSSGSPVISSDGGMGIMQLTGATASSTGYTTSELEWDIEDNIDAGAKVLTDKWNETPIIGDNDKAKLENWYYAIWAYNGWVSGSSYPGAVLNKIDDSPNGQWDNVAPPITPPTAAQIASMKTIPATPLPYHIDSNFDGNLQVVYGSGTDGAKFVADITYPDGSSVPAGQAFTKTWRIENTGNTTWNGSNYEWTFNSGSQMGGASTVAAPTVAPLSTWDVSVAMVAPTVAGTYKGYWQMQGPSGKFGDQCYVDIVVTVSSVGVTLDSSPNPSTYGQSVTFTATISPSVPDGETVTFYDGGTTIGTGSTSGGVATFTTSALAVGGHSITSNYPGDSNYSASTSSTLTQTVNQVSTTTALASSLNPSVIGSSVTFTATISPSVPDGETVTFYDGGTAIGSGTTSGGKAPCTTTALAVGSHSVTATYVGDANDSSSASSALTQTVNPAAPKITGFTPQGGLVGTIVTITGTNLANATSVTFGGVSASISSDSATKIVAVVPTAAVTGLVAVSNAGGTGDSSSLNPSTFMVQPNPTGLSPSTGAAGTTVTITGTGLSGATSVVFGGDVATAPVSDTATQLVVTVPAGALSGYLDITFAWGTVHTMLGFMNPSGGGTYVLWNDAGAVSLWNLPHTGVGTYAIFGPYSGWTPTAMSSDSSGNGYVLWTATNGAAAVWKVTPALTIAMSQGFGPYTGWAAKFIAVGPDNNVHVLWNGPGNEASIFNIVLGASFTCQAYGPYTGLQARQIAVDSNNDIRVLWSNASANEANLWNITGSGVQTSQTLGPNVGWQAQDLAVGTDDLARILWVNTTTNMAQVWHVAADGSTTTQSFGPYSGWSPTGFAVKTNDDSELMWTTTSGSISLFDIGSTGAFTYNSYGPFSGWQAVAMAGSAGPASIIDSPAPDSMSCQTAGAPRR